MAPRSSVTPCGAGTQCRTAGRRNRVEQQGAVQKMRSVWRCMESPSRDPWGPGAGESGFRPCVFGTKAPWVGARSLTGLGKPQGQGSASPAAARFIVEENDFPSQICA